MFAILLITFESLRQSSVILEVFKIIFKNLRKYLGDFRKSSVIFEKVRVIFGNLRKYSGHFRKSLEVFGSLRVNLGNFRNTSDDLRKQLGQLDFSAFLRTCFGNLRCNCTGLTLCTGVTLFTLVFST